MTHREDCKKVTCRLRSAEACTYCACTCDAVRREYKNALYGALYGMLDVDRFGVRVTGITGFDAPHVNFGEWPLTFDVKPITFREETDVDKHYIVIRQQKDCSEKTSRYYRSYSPEGSTIFKPHKTLSDATAEATGKAELSPGSNFVVYEAILAYRGHRPKAVVTVSEAQVTPSPATGGPTLYDQGGKPKFCPGCGAPGGPCTK